MSAKLSLKLDYKSPFVSLLLYGNQSGHRMAWLLNKQLGFDLERINDFKSFENETEATFGLYKYYCHKFNMNFFLLENKNTTGTIIGKAPTPDYLLLIWNKSEFFDVNKFLKQVRQGPGLQAAVLLEKKKEEKLSVFFHDLEYFLESNEDI